MAKVFSSGDLSELSNSVMDLVGKKVGRRPGEKPPLSLADVQDQIRAATEYMRLSDLCKEKSDNWFALAYLVENLKYYSSVTDMGKCGHLLLEMADCLFLCKETTLSSRFCREATTLLVGSKGQYEWAVGMAAIGELLLTAVLLSTENYKEASETLREFRAILTPKEKRLIASEDAHRVARRLLAAYRKRNLKPVQELEEIPPRRKRTEENNLHCLLNEWMGRYGSVKAAVERITVLCSENLKKPEH
ncbi:MAG: hypothetical protein WED04_00235 [Promethearchaeati archaeon SRVP18_Atabeyarchaeia-1]